VSVLIASSHPVPSVVVATLTTVFAWALGLQWWQVGVVFLAMLTNQLGIGLGNDWIDIARDHKAGRADKPLATGVVSADTARNIAVGLGFVALGLSAALSLWAGACQAVMVFAGWWYNAHAKRHWSSPLSYLLGFGLLPVFPSLALSPPSLPAWWVVVVAGLLGIGAHFANALPDLLIDSVGDVRGMPQRVGAKASGLVIAVTVAAATLVITTAGNSLPAWLRVTTALVAIGAAIVAAALAFRPTPPRVIFPLVMVSAAICTLAIANQFVLS
jgi:4-hydroxybenzoate polyprenyltransferase